VTPWRWWRKRRREKRRQKAAEQTQQEPLREFVYLDEVSVFSLLASRIGALATDFTDTESSSLSSEVRSQVGVSTPVAKAGVSSGIKAAETSGTQVLRKSTVQSTFKELYGYIRDSLVMRVGFDQNEVPQVSAPEDLIEKAGQSEDWIVDADSLRRGQVLEVEVALDADDSFRASTIFSTLLGFLQELPQMPATIDREGIADAISGMRLLDGLLAGLVPVRGRSLDYAHVTVGERELLVHQRLVSQLEDSEALVIRPLYIVGVAEAELFWRDVRRILFSESHYRVLCRLGRGGTHSTWTPVKLTDVLEGVVPTLRGLVDQIPAMLAQASEDDPDQGPVEAMRRALTSYAISVCAHYGQTVTVEDLSDRGLPTAEQLERHRNFDERRDAFRSLTDDLVSAYGIEKDPVPLTHFRTEATISAGLGAGGANVESRRDPTPPAPGRQPRYLDCELIAVYW
jgi:hypothetical protein